MNNTTELAANSSIVLYDLYSSTAQIIGYSLAYGLLGSFALIGNAMVLIVVFMNKSMRSTINILLVNLSISDILFLLLSAPGHLVTEICNQRWILGVAMAKIVHLFSMLSSSASVFTFMAIAFERYFAVVHPLKDRTRNKKCAMIWALSLIWFCSFAFSIPFGVFTDVMVVPLDVKVDGNLTKRDVQFLSLTIDMDDFKIYYLIIFIGLHVVPFVSLGVLYGRIAWKLWHPDKQLNQECAGAGANERMVRMTERNRRRTTFMVIAILVAFIICFFPLHIYFIYQLFKPDYDSKPTDVTSILRILVLINAAINPVIYNILSDNFRARFRAILACCARRKSQQSVGSNSASLDTIQTAANGYNVG